MSSGQFKVEVDGRSFDVELDGSRISVDGKPVKGSIAHVVGDTYSLLLDGRSHEFTLSKNGKTALVSGIARRQSVEVLDRIALLLRESKSDSSHVHATEVVAPMPGLVLKLEVEPGDQVTRGEGLVVLEAMKMENEIFASGEGVVAKVHVEEGQPVTKGQLLVTLE